MVEHHPWLIGMRRAARVVHRGLGRASRLSHSLKCGAPAPLAAVTQQAVPGLSRAAVAASALPVGRCRISGGRRRSPEGHQRAGLFARRAAATQSRAQHRRTIHSSALDPCCWPGRHGHSRGDAGPGTDSCCSCSTHDPPACRGRYSHLTCQPSRSLCRSLSRDSYALQAGQPAGED